MMLQAFSLMSSDNVAQIVETGYPCPTVQDAVYAVADGQTIQLLKNITISGPDSIEIKDDKSFTLDLNGYVISKSSLGTAISHSGSGTLTITDSSSEKSGKITADKSAIVFVEAGCSGRLVVTGGTVNSTGDGRSAIYNDSGSAEVIIAGGAVTGANVAIDNHSTGSVSVSGGSVTGAKYGISNNGGSVSVSGGSVTTAGFAAIYNQSGSVSLSGGSVTSTASDWPAIICLSSGKTYISGDAKITSVNDGTAGYDYKGTIYLSISGAADEFEVTGGTIENTHASGTAIHINSGTVEIPSGSPVIKGGGQAMNKAPNLSGYTDVFILGSTTSTEGVEAAEITKADIDTNEKVQTYKYLEFGPATTPGAPTGLAATPNDGQLTLTWTAPAITGGSAIQHYEYSLDGVNWTSTGSADTSYTITGLTNGKSYTVKVRAVNGKGRGTESASITATLPYTDQEAVDAEAAKYAETAVIESNVAVGTDVTATVARLLTGETADSSITLSYAASTGDYLEVVGNAVKLKKQKTDAGDAAQTVTITFSKGEKTAAKQVTVTIKTSYTGGGGGSSGGGSTKSGSDNNTENNNSTVIITSPSPDNPDTPTQAKITVPGTTDSQGNVTVDITEQTVTDAVNKALEDAKAKGNEEKGIIVILHVDTGSQNVSTVNVNLPKPIQEAIIINRIVTTIIVVDNPDIRINMDLRAVEEINRQANDDVNVIAARTDSSQLSEEAQKAIGSRPVFDLRVDYGSGGQVENYGTGKVTVSIPYTLGPDEKAENIKSVYIDSNGNVHWLSDSVYDSANQVLVFTTSHFSTYGVGYMQDTLSLEDVPGFTDINGHWAKADIEYAVSQGLFSGTSATTFSPDTAMTRGMFVTVLGRLARADVKSYQASSFDDVQNDLYYMGFIEWANRNGIVKGMGDKKFAPDQAITREQMAVIMSNYTRVMNLDLKAVQEERHFADNDKISPYAREAVKEMQMARLVSGKDNNLFDPQGTATRAEVSSVLHRFMGVSGRTM